MGQTHFRPVGRIAEGDQTARLGVLDRSRIGDAGERPDVERLAHRQDVDHGADRGRQRADPRFDELDQRRGDHRPTAPPPAAALVHQPAVGDLLLDDVVHVQGVAAGKAPQPACRRRIDGSAEGPAQQCCRLLRRQRLEIDPVELAGGPDLRDTGRNRFAVTDGEHHLRGAPTNDLVQHEGGQIVEQV
jgi:hypothetical protein